MIVLEVFLGVVLAYGAVSAFKRHAARRKVMRHFKVHDLRKHN